MPLLTSPDRSARAARPAAARAAGRRALAALTTVARSAVTPLVPADYLDLVAPLRSGADLRGRVVAVHGETCDAVTVVIRPGRGWAGHVPGQYIRIGVDIDGVRRWRAYSLTCPPSGALGSAGLLSITVKAIADGTVSRHVVRELRPGTLVHLDQAAGDFTLGDHRGPVLFVTAGSGITPVMGMLRTHLRERGELDDVVLVHSAPTAGDVVFGTELRELHASGALRLVERHTAAEGILTPAELDTLVPDWRRREAWACGPTAMLDAFETHYADAGLPGRLHTERFRPALAAVGEGGTVTFARSGTVVQADGSTTLLDAGEDAGVLMPSGCRMGICFGCVVGLREGAVRDLRSGDVTTAVPEDGIRIQTCVSAAAGACHIDL
jgi:ferredoxin-NADP reductase